MTGTSAGGKRRDLQELKGKLSNPGILVTPRRHAPKKLMTDASDYGLGVVLLQEAYDGRWMPVAFASRKMTDPERK